MKFSLEIGPQTNLETIPAVNDVYITMLPGGDYKETSLQAINLVKRGFSKRKILPFFLMVLMISYS